MYFYNNQYFDENKTVIDIRDRGLLLGDGLFETLRADQIAPIDFERHWQRLATSAASLAIPMPISQRTGLKVVETLLLNNDLSNAAIRITLTRGDGGRGLVIDNSLVPNLLITATTKPSSKAQVDVVLSDFVRNEHSLCAQHKTLCYLDAIMARQLAKQSGRDDALLKNSHGHYVCATAANLFAIQAGTLITPPTDAGALPGITRAKVIAEAQRLAIPVHYQALAAKDIFAADGLFLTNSLCGLQWVHKCDDHTYDNNDSKLFQALQAFTF